MKAEIFDPNVSETMNIFVVIANVLNLFYNLPQMWVTYKRKTTKDISGLFLSLRIITNIIWIGYAIEIESLLFLTSTIVTIISSLFIGIYKTKEILVEFKRKNQNILLETKKEERLPLRPELSPPARPGEYIVFYDGEVKGRFFSEGECADFVIMKLQKDCFVHYEPLEGEDESIAIA